MRKAGRREPCFVALEPARLRIDGTPWKSAVALRFASNRRSSSPETESIESSIASAGSRLRACRRGIGSRHRAFRSLARVGALVSVGEDDLPDDSLHRIPAFDESAGQVLEQFGDGGPIADLAEIRGRTHDPARTVPARSGSPPHGRLAGDAPRCRPIASRPLPSNGIGFSLRITPAGKRRGTGSPSDSGFPRMFRSQVFGLELSRALQVWILRAAAAFLSVSASALSR